MNFRELKGKPWTAIGRHVYAQGPDGPPVLVAVIDETDDTNPSTTNAIAAHVVDLHNANLTRRIINASGAPLEAARRNG